MLSSSDVTTIHLRFAKELRNRFFNEH